MRPWNFSPGLLPVVLLSFVLPATPQTTYGVVEGLVRDASQAVVPGASIELKNEATGVAQTLRADDAGRFRFVNLPPSQYSVVAAKEGFRKAQRTGVIVKAGEITVADLVLSVGSVTEIVNVGEVQPEIQAATSHLSTVVPTREVTELPLSGRDFARLALLAPGVTSEQQGGVGQFATHGQRSTTNTFTVDGTDINNPYWNVLQGGALGTATAFASVDGIAEVRVMTSTFSAEYGRTSGAFVTAVTKSGSNGFHGTAFDFFRNDKLNAADFFVNSARATKPPLRFNNFGGSAGGPIVRNKAFFFFLYEGQRERRSGLFPAIVPALSVQQLADPVLRPLFKFLPVPTGPEILDSAGNPTRLAPLNLRTLDNKNEDDFQFRVDYNPTNKDSLYFRGTTSDGVRLQVNSFLPPTLVTQNDYALKSGTLVYTRLFSPRVVNELRLGSNRQTTPFASRNAAGQNLISFDEAGHLTNPRFSISGSTISIFGGLGPVTQVINVFQWTDNLSWLRGPHSMKFGVDIRRTQVNQANNQTWFGSYSFPSVTAFINNAPASFLAIRGRVATYPRTANFSFYAQDDYKIRPRLTLNLGLRYELNAVVNEAQGQISNLVPINDIRNAQAVVGARYNGDHNNFAPRIGFAWDMTGDQKNVLRGGSGIFYDVGPGYWGPLAIITNPPATYTPFLSGAEARYPVNEALLDPSRGLRASILAIPPDNRNTYTFHQNLTYQRSLPWSFVGTASYVGSLGRKLYRLRPSNLRDASGQLLSSRFNQINISENSALSSYHALETTLNRNFGKGLTMRASYAYGHAIDDSSGFAFYDGAPSVASNPFNLRADRSSSSFDIRHNFTWNYVYELPFARSLKGAAARIVGGWELSGIVTARTGLPYTVLLGSDNANVGLSSSSSQSPQRPNLVTGVPLTQGPRQGPNYRLNKAAFETPPRGAFGNLGRNTFRAAPFTTWDSGIFKNTRFGKDDRYNVQFRTEYFNILNHPNFGVPGRTNLLTTPDANFGVTDTSASRPREIQFALKFYF